MAIDKEIVMFGEFHKKALLLGLSLILTFGTFARAAEKGPLVNIETTDGFQMRGFLQGTGGDSITLMYDIQPSWLNRWTTAQRTTSLHLSDISSLSLSRSFPIYTTILSGLIPGGVGILLGLSSGDDPPGIVRFTAGQKAAILGCALGGMGLSIGGSVGALKSIDVDIPLIGKSGVEKKAILSRIQARHYRAQPNLKVSPRLGILSGPHGRKTALFGGRFRYYFTPRSGCELNYGETPWFSTRSRYYFASWSEVEQSKINSISGGFFIFPFHKRFMNPFVAWGWGLTKIREKTKTQWELGSGEYDQRENGHTDHSFSVHLSGGVEIPLTEHLSLEGSLEEMAIPAIDNYGTIQLAITVGLNP
jgi:hypothetical protein